MPNKVVGTEHLQDVTTGTGMPDFPLLPCPFCGEVPEVKVHGANDQWWMIRCEGESCAAHLKFIHDDRKMLMRWWNTRKGV